MSKTNNKNIKINKNYPRIILGLDVSTVCIGVSIIADFGEGIPEILKITHISPKISTKIKGIEALLKRKDIFENDFLPTLKDYNITDVIIEEPLISSNNCVTVATLLKFNGMICESIYRILGIVPHFISSYDARTYSFPDLISIRKTNKKGENLELKQIERLIKSNHAVLFGEYPYNVDKKSVMMTKVNELYPNINWILNTKGELKKENFDACDSLVCALAYVNINRYGLFTPNIKNCIIHKEEKNVKIDYTLEVWNKEYIKEIVI
jgi:hypothetical protein